MQSGGGGGGAGASTSAATGQNQYRLNNSATYYGSDATGGNANAWRSGVGGSMYQGGETASGGSYNGTMKSLGIIGGNAQSDLSGKTIDQVTIRLEWLHTWYGSGAYVILGYTGRTSTPLSWNGGGITAVKTWWQGGNPVTTDLTGAGLGTALASGAAQSISLGPGSAYNLNNYGYMYGAGGDNAQNPLITVNWHTGTAPVQAGAGCDGRVIITYTVAGVLTAALQPAAGTDAAGNAFGSGYTGNVQAIQPGSSPSVVETWHDMRPLSGSFVGTISGQLPPQYRLTADGCVEFAGKVQSPGTTGNYNGTIFYTLPAGYRPNHAVQLVLTAVADGAATPVLTINPNGTLTLNFLPTSLAQTVIGIFGRFPLDSTGLIQS